MLVLATVGFLVDFWAWALVSPLGVAYASLLTGGFVLGLGGTTFPIGVPLVNAVHVVGAPVGYLWRPYIVYRSRESRLGTRATPRGWERLGTPAGR
jgi:nitrate reductase gamma subunit